MNCVPEHHVQDTGEVKLTAQVLPPTPLSCVAKSLRRPASCASTSGSTYCDADGEGSSLSRSKSPAVLTSCTPHDGEPAIFQERLPGRATAPTAASGNAPRGAGAKEAASARRSGCGGCFSWLSLLGPSSWQSAEADVLGRDFRRSCSVLVHSERLESLEQIGLIGCGAFGTVTLVRCSKSQRSFALKAVSKGLVVQRHMQHAVLNEKLVLKRVRSPWTVQLESAFTTDEHLYFLMEVAMGGDLCTVYTHYPFFGSECHARFYTGCVLRALDHLHSCEVLYRDLKMENVVVESSGYAKLCDFGMAACLTERNGWRAYTICGTSGYMAPEVAVGAGYSYGVDWWCLGVLLFELMTGDGPFAAADPAVMQEKKAKGIDAVAMPEGASWPDLVRKLCRADPAQRLPLLSGGIRNVMKHEWYTSADFSWEAHGLRAMTPNHIPVVDGPEDMRNFSAMWMDRPQSVSYVDEGSGWDKAFAAA